jgi:hypothetical protein
MRGQGPAGSRTNSAAQVKADVAALTRAKPSAHCPLSPCAAPEGSAEREAAFADASRAIFCLWELIGPADSIHGLLSEADRPYAPPTLC